MSSIKNFIWKMLFDDSDTTDKLAKNQAAIDAQAEDWRSKRNTILLEMHGINQGISLTIQSIRMVTQAAGIALSPVQNALLSLISSTMSIIIATATALAAGSMGVLAGAAFALATYAWSFSAVQTVKILAESEEVRVAFEGVIARLAELESRQTTMGRLF